MIDERQKIGIGLIIFGIIIPIIVPKIIQITEFYFLYEFFYRYYFLLIIEFVSIGFGIKILISKNNNYKDPSIEDDTMNNNEDSIQNSGQINEDIKIFSDENVPNNVDNVPEQKFIQKNKVVNVTLSGGLIGLIAGSPNIALNSRIKKENQNGWKVVQIIPSTGGNILLTIIRFIILVLTLFLYTTAEGYYIVFEKIDNKNI